MKIAWFDGQSGASGDMILGSLLDAGLSFDHWNELLHTLSIPDFTIETSKVTRGSIAATSVRVIPAERDSAHRHYPDIVALIDGSSLPDGVKRKSKDIFGILGEAEAGVHGVSLEEIHFHEVGAVDSIVDIVGAVLGIHLLDVKTVYSGVPVTGTGQVECEHGLLPVPAPATIEILRGRELRVCDQTGELLTPTGAALLVGLTEQFGPPPEMKLEAIGYGAGGRDRAGTPNVLRLSIGEIEEPGVGSDRVVVLECDVDHLPPELLGALFERSMKEGALDITILPTVRKKNRPGHRVSLLAPDDGAEKFSQLLLEETGSLGVRISRSERRVVPREIVTRETRYGPMRFKIATMPGSVRIWPEFDDCESVAAKKGISVREVWESALRDGGESG